MNSSLFIKHILSRLIGFSGQIKNSIRSKSVDKYPILMYHRIIPSGEVGHTQAGMFVDPATFEMQIRYLKIYFDVIPLCEIMNDNNHKSVTRKERPVCIITFDDGWFDFYKYAYPILEAYNVPATVFLPTNFIGSERRFWTEQLSELIINRKPDIERNEVTKIIPPDLVLEKILNLRGSHQSITERAISLLKELREDEVRGILQQLKTTWGVTETSHEGVFLQWEEVQIMEKSGLVSFGSHTNSHKILTLLNEEEIHKELLTSKETLISKNVVHPSFIPFSYPNGNYNERVVHLVQDVGYHVALTTDNGWNDHETHPFRLRRMAIHQDMSSTKDMFGCRITNIF